MSKRICSNCLHNIRGTEYVPPCSDCRDYSLWAENPEPSNIEQLQAELDKANVLAEFYLEGLNKSADELDTANKENERLREKLDTILNIAALALNPNLKNDIKQALKAQPPCPDPE